MWVPLVTSSDAKFVALTYKHHTFLLEVTTVNLRSQARVCFESIDCSGAPLMQVGSANILQSTLAATADPGITFYLPNPDAIPQSTTTHSCAHVDFVNPSACSTDGGAGLWVPAVVGVDLATRFAPPFKIK